MPGRPDHDGDHHLGLLETAWDATQEHWRDDMSRHFGQRYWTPLRAETRDYLQALRKLMDLLNAAERDTEY